MTITIATIVGARPQFIKAAAISRAINESGGSLRDIIIHTGQHYDANMSDVFFDELGIPQPAYNLGIGGNGLDQGAMTGRMIEAIETVLLKEKPDWVLLHGDTNSTLAGAIAAAKLNIPIAHVEAGLRSYNKTMPEEINRVVTDRVSTLLFCPTETAIKNLAAEGITEGVYETGDVMFDASLFYHDLAREKSTVMQRLGLKNRSFGLVTCHRSENTDQPQRLREIALAIAELSLHHTLVIPLHPRTRNALAQHDLMHFLKKAHVIDPLPYLDMVCLEQAARVVMTDSGGVQKEAFFYGVPCVTMRDETEWVETVETGFNRLTGANSAAIIDAYEKSVALNLVSGAWPYGNGHAAERICTILEMMAEEKQGTVATALPKAIGFT
jgi:UDP-GlcNAc3NAcA epimerase